MKIYNVLNKYAVSEIQNYLADMDRANREYKGEQLNIFLQGLNYALWESGYALYLRSETENGITTFRVEAHHFSEPKDAWNGEGHLFNIFANRIEEL